MRIPTWSPDHLGLPASYAARAVVTLTRLGWFFARSSFHNDEFLLLIYFFMMVSLGGSRSEHQPRKV